jgi:hypothetical protein
MEQFLKAQAEIIAQQNSKIDDLTREVNRKTYIASSLAALIIKTGNEDLIHKSAQIAEEASNC